MPSIVRTPPNLVSGQVVYLAVHDSTRLNTFQLKLGNNDTGPMLNHTGALDLSELSRNTSESYSQIQKVHVVTRQQGQPRIIVRWLGQDSRDLVSVMNFKLSKEDGKVNQEEEYL